MYALFIRDRWVDAPDCKVNLCSDRFWISGILESNKKIFAVPDSADWTAKGKFALFLLCGQPVGYGALIDRQLTRQKHFSFYSYKKQSGSSKKS